MESLRANDCIGVKKEMWKIIQTLTNEERMKYIFLEGSKYSGKSNLIQKIRIYALNRKVFTDDLTLDLRVNGHSIETILALRLYFEAKIERFREMIEKKLKVSK